MFFTNPERNVFKSRELNKAGRPLTTSEWAEKYRVVAKGPAQGRWTNDLTPYLIGVMDCFTLPYIRKIYMCFAPQSGKTQGGLNCMAYAADQAPGPMMYIMPDERVMRRLSRRQITPLFKDTPKLNSLLSARDNQTNTMAITLNNGTDIMMAWATSPSAMASESVQYLFADEPEKWVEFSGKEASSFDLADMRTNAFPYTKKQMFFSTPNEANSQFARKIQDESDIYYQYHAICPKCQHGQRLIGDNIIYPEKIEIKTMLRKKLGRYKCADCGLEWDDTQRNIAVRLGVTAGFKGWFPYTNPNKNSWNDIKPIGKPIERPEAVAFQLAAFYSPFVSLSQSAAAKAAGRKDPRKQITYVTQFEAKPFFASVNHKKESDILKLRSQYQRNIIPNEALALTAGIDMQQYGFWYVIRAWGKDFTSWLIDYGKLSNWEGVTYLLTSQYQKENSSEHLPIWRAALDTGGGKKSDQEWSRTEESYQYIRNFPIKNKLWGIKGASRKQLQRVKTTIIDKLPGSHKPIPGGLELKILDTDQFKDTIRWRIDRKEDESQRFWLHKDTGIDYAQQILAEEKRRDRAGKITWHSKKNNHLSDCENYAAACIDAEWSPSFQLLANRMITQSKQPHKDTKKNPNKIPDVLQKW